MTKKHVSLVFHRYLNGDIGVRNYIKIYFNGDEIHGIDPFLTDNPATQPLSEQQIRIDKYKTPASNEVQCFLLTYLAIICYVAIQSLGGMF